MTTGFACEKRPATGAGGMVATNHPLASAAGAELLAGGGNAVDAAIAALFALTIVEPMMVGLTGGGVAHLRLPDGRHVVLDGLSTAPGAARPDMYRVKPGTPDHERDCDGEANLLGGKAVAVPAALAAWCHALERYGSRSLPEVLAPAIRLAEEGFRVTSYLAECVGDAAADLARDDELASLFLPQGAPIRPGERLVQRQAAATLREVACRGAAALFGEGALRDVFLSGLAAKGGIVTAADLEAVRVLERDPIRTVYRGLEILGPPPPASSGVHIAQMLNILEGFDLGALGFGTAETCHLIAEALKIAFADRAVATADPDFVRVPVARLTSRAYADERRAMIGERAGRFIASASLRESANTTHVTVADRMGGIFAATQTINSLFGARIGIPGTGLIANNYMFNFEPRPGRALSVAPGKRVFTSMAPMIAVRDGRPAFALGCPGGLRIFGSVMQAIIAVIDHRMDLQHAVEAPRIWTQGAALELEPGIPVATEAALVARGHAVQRVRAVGGGLNAISFGADGFMTGAACWRADGTVMALGGGLARAGVRFSPDAAAPR